VHPVSGRLIPVIADAQLVDPTLGTGAVKVTPAHDANDYECGLWHGLEQVRSSALLLYAACLNAR
jgi:valyl-tRNA synthetase